MSQIKYIFTFGASQKAEFTVTDRGFDESQDSTDNLPEWTLLTNKQCENCPLQATECHYCPVSVDISTVAERFSQIMGYTETKVRVITDDRIYYKETDVTSALKSLFGLIMANSNCPVLGRLRPMARSHLPFSTFVDTMRRMVGAYMVRQYFKWTDGEEPDFGLYGVDELFKELQKVNESLAVRITGATTKDSSIEAVLKFIETTGSSTTIWENMQNLRAELGDGF